MNKYKGVSTEAPRGDWMQTFTGIAFYPADPRPEEIFIEDIAHALSLQCRYGGHCDRHYSVAEHSVLVSQMVPPEDALAGLMHDATEAYLMDIPRPVKALLPQYRDLEDALWAVIAKRFDLSPVLPQAVHDADNRILNSERDANMKKPPQDWGVPDDGSRITVHFWSAKVAEREFIRRFRELTGQLRPRPAHAKLATTTHGAYTGGGETPEHYIWRTMIARCHTPSAKGYPSYGGRGIKVCARWRKSYSAFLRDMGERPPGKSLDRKDNNGPYSPKNCRWATASQQQLNKRGTRWYACDGKVQPISQWAEELGISRALASYRMKTQGTLQRGKIFRLQKGN